MKIKKIKSTFKLIALSTFMTTVITPTAQAQYLETIKDSVRYLGNTQVKIDNAPKQFYGEWPSYMMNDNDIVLLGYKGKVAYDSNLFTTASIHNSLATAYLKLGDELSEVPLMLERAMDNILTYKNKKTNAFGFWPILPLEDKFKSRKERKNSTYVEIRRPNHYKLESKFINNAANVPDDADDTAVSYIAMKLNNEIAKKTNLTATQIPVDKIGPFFSAHRDRFGKRKSLHYYNVLHGMNLFTGAFMTWLQKEKLFTPWSWAPTNHKDRYIPYGANEVDCVVNANVLNALATFDELDTKGVKKACKFIKKSFKNPKRSSLCGLYYPNHFHLHYVTAKAINSGATCLNDIKDKIVGDIIQRQSVDGSHNSEPRKKSSPSKKMIEVINKAEHFMRKGQKNDQEVDLEWLENLDPNDTLQSSIYAALALSYLKDEDNAIHANSLKRSIDYILSQKQTTEQGSFWKGGVFFAGGTLVRNDLNWRSNPYTTGLVIELLSKENEKEYTNED